VDGCEISPSLQSDVVVVGSYNTILVFFFSFGHVKSWSVDWGHYSTPRIHHPWIGGVPEISDNTIFSGLVFPRMVLIIIVQLTIPICELRLVRPSDPLPSLVDSDGMTDPVTLTKQATARRPHKFKLFFISSSFPQSLMRGDPVLLN
jgi:hypothetical protein